jgi:hypothetical protein
MKRRALAATHPAQERHPTLDTFERVMTSGVVVDRGPSEQDRQRWLDASLAGRDLLAVEFESFPRSMLRQRSGEE